MATARDVPNKVQNFGASILGDERNELRRRTTISWFAVCMSDGTSEGDSVEELTDDSNSLSGERNVVSPPSRVEDFSLKVVDTLHTLRSVEGNGESSHSTDEDLELLLPDLSGDEILEFDLVVLSLLTPDGADEEGRELGLLSEVVLLEDKVPVLLDFRLRRVDGGPVGVEFGGERVPVRGNVASTATGLSASDSILETGNRIPKGNLRARECRRATRRRITR